MPRLSLLGFPVLHHRVMSPICRVQCPHFALPAASGPFSQLRPIMFEPFPPCFNAGLPLGPQAAGSKILMILHVRRPVAPSAQRRNTARLETPLAHSRPSLRDAFLPLWTRRSRKFMSPRHRRRGPGSTDPSTGLPSSSAGLYHSTLINPNV